MAIHPHCKLNSMSPQCIWTSVCLKHTVLQCNTAPVYTHTALQCSGRFPCCTDHSTTLTSLSSLPISPAPAEMDASGSKGTPLPLKSTLNEVEAENVASPPAVPVRPSKPTGIVNPSPQKLPMAEQIPDVQPHRISPNPPSLMPLRKSDNAVSDVQDTSKSREKGFVPRNVVLSEKQKKLGVRPLQSVKSPKVPKQQQNSALPVEESKNSRPPLLTFVSNVNESFAVGKDHSQWTPVQDAVEEVYSSTARSPAQSQQESESITNHENVPKRSVPSLPSASDVAADALSMLPPALRDKQPKVARVSPTLHAKPVARVLPSVNKTPTTSSVVKRDEGNENGCATGSGTGDRSQPQQPSGDVAKNKQGDRPSQASYGPAIPSLEQGKAEKDTGGNLNEHRRRRKKKKHRLADSEESESHRLRERLHKKKKRKKKHKRHRSSEDARIKPRSSHSSTEDDPTMSHRYSSTTKGSLTKAYRTESDQEDRLVKHYKASSSLESSLHKYPGSSSRTGNGLVHDRCDYGREKRRNQESTSSSSNPDHNMLANASKSGRHSPVRSEDLAKHPVKRRKASHGGWEWNPPSPLKGRPGTLVYRGWTPLVLICNVL